MIDLHPKAEVLRESLPFRVSCNYIRPVFTLAIPYTYEADPFTADNGSVTTLFDGVRLTMSIHLAIHLFTASFASSTSPSSVAACQRVHKSRPIQSLYQEGVGLRP